jgi:hypothetical protein
MPKTGKVSISKGTGATHHYPPESEPGDVEGSRFQVAMVGQEGGEEDDGTSTQNQNTYFPDKTLGQLTREVLPKYDNYRNLMSVHAGVRPTLDELHDATFHEKVSSCFKS